jgi:hypothetical protein
MSKAKTMIALALVAAGGGYAWHAHGSAVADGKQSVVDRIWIDHMPKSETDKVNIFLALSEETAGQEVGIYQTASQWTGAHEIFLYAQKRGKLVATFPQTGDTEELSAKATRCDKGDMDFCLTIDGGSRGVKQYYSREGWEIEGSHTAAELEQRAEQLTKFANPVK